MLKRIVSLLLALVVVFSVIPSVNAEAAMNISKKKATMEVDSTLVLSIKGATQKPTWKTSSKTVATVTKNGKVTAKAEGTATITATLNGNKYTCVVTVVDSNKVADTKKAAFDATKVKKQIKEVASYEWVGLFGDYAGIVLKNNSEYMVSLSVDVRFFDENHEVISLSSGSEYAFEPGTERFLYFSTTEDYDTYEYTISVKEEKYYIGVVKNLDFDVNLTSSKAILAVTNNGTVAANFVECDVLFFKDGHVIATDYAYATDDDSQIKPGDTQYAQADFFSLDYDTFDDVKVFLSGRGSRTR